MLNHLRKLSLSYSLPLSIIIIIIKFFLILKINFIKYYNLKRIFVQSNYIFSILFYKWENLTVLPCQVQQKINFIFTSENQSKSIW